MEIMAVESLRREGTYPDTASRQDRVEQSPDRRRVVRNNCRRNSKNQEEHHDDLLKDGLSAIQ